jgi:hypothetical protein
MSSIVVRGHFDGKNIVPDEPVDLPSEQQLEIRVRVVSAGRTHRRRRSRITSLPFFGMWSDREEMRDASEWVRKERERWSERLTR